MAWEDLTAAQQSRIAAFANKIGAGNVLNANMGRFWAVVDSIGSGNTQASAALRRQATALSSALQSRASQ